MRFHRRRARCTPASLNLENISTAEIQRIILAVCILSGLVAIYSANTLFSSVFTQDSVSPEHVNIYPDVPSASAVFEQDVGISVLDAKNNHTFGGLRFAERKEEEPLFPYFGTSILDTKNYRTLGGGRFSAWKNGDTPFTPTPGMKVMSDKIARGRRVHVKAAMQHAWGGYSTLAFGYDEVQPISGKGNYNWEGLGTTLVDSLDTLWLMGMKDEFYEARDWIDERLTKGLLHEKDTFVSMFETTIRSLGGYLAAYDWSGDEVFLNAAKDLADRLLPAFDSPSGVPWNTVHLITGEGKNEEHCRHETNLASAGTVQVEFRYLAKVTGEMKYAVKAEKAFDKLKALKSKDGLYPLGVVNTEKVIRGTGSRYTFGGKADSFYEYMLKLWIQGGKREKKYRMMYDESMDGMHKMLLQHSEPNGLTYIGQKRHHNNIDEMEHLACFVSGMLALGAYTDPNGLDSDRAQRDLRTGKALAYTCYQMYASTKTGLAPEIVGSFGDNSEEDFVPKYDAESYLLRPEVVESLYILHKLTGDPIYREWGWEIFQSIEKYCKTDIAYGKYSNVEDTGDGEETGGQVQDSMESFFLGETLKYLYLLFDPDSPVDLNKHVFNTEAHPLRSFEYL
mmetsp:Transcript_8756/g.10228  ORF Transcript_8756/g.10228 Transcript_8756/m.10228 type:complete len:620 (+) Transcript_8756:102-1961(+)